MKTNIYYRQCWMAQIETRIRPHLSSLIIYTLTRKTDYKQKQLWVGTVVFVPWGARYRKGGRKRPRYCKDRYSFYWVNNNHCSSYCSQLREYNGLPDAHKSLSFLCLQTSTWRQESSKSSEFSLFCHRMGLTSQ